MARATAWRRMRSSFDIWSAALTKMPPGRSVTLASSARGNQPHDLFVEQLPVTGVIFVPDHQVHRQSFQTPVRVGLDELAHQIDIGRVSDLQQHDRQIAGNGVAPQAGLPAAVLAEDARVGAQRGIGVDDGAGKVSIELRVGLRGIELPQDHLAMGPCQIEDAIREPPILVFLDKAQGSVASLPDAGDNVDRCRFLRIERDSMTDRDNRIEHGALAARERCGASHRLRIGDRVSAADEPHAVGLIGDFSDVCPMHGHQVKHPWRRLADGAGPAGAEDRLAAGGGSRSEQRDC